MPEKGNCRRCGARRVKLYYCLMPGTLEPVRVCGACETNFATDRYIAGDWNPPDHLQRWKFRARHARSLYNTPDFAETIQPTAAGSSTLPWASPISQQGITRL